jgi:hypothetical protein
MSNGVALVVSGEDAAAARDVLDAAERPHE